MATKTTKALLPCAVCKGKKTITITSTFHEASGTTTNTSEAKCFDCKGTGTMTAARVAAHKAEMALWCRCGKSDESDPTFHDDGQCRQCDKHHYHCGWCGKISQVG